jgi:hypothetical protein
MIMSNVADLQDRRDEMIPLTTQATAVRRAAINHAGHVNNLRDLVARGKRPQHELDIAAQWLPALLAAADTMETLAVDKQHRSLQETAS